jgi:hypothetical protein
MKRINLPLAIGAFCVVAGALGCFLWFQSQPPPATPSATDAVTEPALDESKPNRGGARADKFAALDTDQDGKLSLTEFSAGRAPAEATKWFERRDADHDGFVSKQEFLPQSALSRTR